MFELAVWSRCGLPEVVDALPEPGSKSLALGSLVGSKDPALLHLDGHFSLIRCGSSMFGWRHAGCSCEGQCHGGHTFCALLWSGPSSCRRASGPARASEHVSWTMCVRKLLPTHTFRSIDAGSSLTDSQ